MRFGILLVVLVSGCGWGPVKDYALEKGDALISKAAEATGTAVGNAVGSALGALGDRAISQLGRPVSEAIDRLEDMATKPVPADAPLSEHVWPVLATAFLGLLGAGAARNRQSDQRKAALERAVAELQLGAKGSA